MMNEYTHGMFNGASYTKAGGKWWLLWNGRYYGPYPTQETCRIVMDAIHERCGAVIGRILGNEAGNEFVAANESESE